MKEPANSSRRKRDHERAVRTSISMSPPMMTAAEQRAQMLGYTSFSHYLQSLIRHDAMRQPQALAA